MRLIKFIFLLFLILPAQIVTGQSTIDITYENTEGVIFCRSFHGEDYLKTYTVFDLEPAQVLEFEKLLRETGTAYTNYVRQYQGVKKENINLLVASLTHKNVLDKSQNWRKEPIIIIDGCEDTRTIVYNLDEEKIFYDKSGWCDH